MKELNDDELQQWLEGGKTPPAGESDDIKAYNALFDLLKAEPEDGLPYDFSAKVIRSVETQTQRKSEFKYNLLAAIIFIVILVSAWFSVNIYNPQLSAALLPYKWLLLSAPLIFIIIQYLDQRLIKRKLLRGL